MDRSEPEGVVVSGSAEDAVRRVRDVDMTEVRVGPESPAPLALARALHRARPELRVVVTLRPDEAGRLDRALSATPLVLGPLAWQRSGHGRRSPERSSLGPDFWRGLEGSPDVTLLVDGAGMVLAANAPACALFGRDERDLLGALLPRFFVEAERGRLLARLRDGGSAVWTDESGRPVDVTAWRYPGGDPTVRVVVLREPSRTELEVRAQERFLSAIVENVPNMLFVKEAEGLRFVRFNRAGEELLGYARQDLLGRNDYDIFPKDEADFFTEKDREVMRGGTVVDIAEEPIHTRAGLRWLHTRKVPVLDPAGKPLYLLGISEDITARKLAEDERDRLIQELRRSNADLEQFATIASHDLQEPLRKIQMFGDRLQASLGRELSAEALDSIRRMNGAASRMQELLYGLLAWSRISTRGQPFERVALDGVLVEVLADLEARMERSGGTVEVGPLPVVLGDRPQLRQLFQNLVGNGLKFHAPGVRPRVRVAVQPARPGRVEVLVTDDGIGFSPADAAALFQPFQRLHGRDRYEGTGMGLAICRRIVERHGGSIRAVPHLDAGATFVVELPAG